MLSGVFNFEITAQITGIEADPVDPIRLRIGYHRITIASRFGPGEAGDLHAFDPLDLRQCEGLTDGLPEVDPASVADNRTGNVEILRIVAAALTVTGTDVHDRGTRAEVGRTRAAAGATVAALHRVIGIAVFGQIAVDADLGGAGVLLRTGRNEGPRRAGFRTQRKRH
ncbi:hypothetical protein D3C81_1384190 [compost metagenome]